LKYSVQKLSVVNLTHSSALIRN